MPGLHCSIVCAIWMVDERADVSPSLKLRYTPTGKSNVFSVQAEETHTYCTYTEEKNGSLHTYGVFKQPRLHRDSLRQC